MSERDFDTRPISEAWEPEGDDLLAAFAQARAEQLARRQPDSGDLVGRYTVLSLLGRGGMGTVYKAYDPQLDRNVAVKLLRRMSVSIEGERESEQRLLREAQTLARLQHPNVVAVFDAGLTGFGVFIAMELVDGRTLSEWLDERVRSVSDILDVFVAAGQGLIAVHDAGFVHRDFKPSNVLVGSDESVRVLDFGLASLIDPDGDLDDPVSVSRREISRPPGMIEPRSGSGAVRTDDGVVMGTPAFMAPEQLLGERADHRSEQFTFCVCLHLALYGHSPLLGESYDERRCNILRGEGLDEARMFTGPKAGKVPKRVRRALMRGLAALPADRFPSMRALLAELQPSGRRWSVAVGGLVLVGSFAGGAAAIYATDDACDPKAAFEGVWGAADRTAVRDAFERSGHIGATDLHERVRQQLDAYQAEWIAMYEDSCHATFSAHQQSDLLHDYRMRCLERRRDRMRSAIDALAEISEPKQAVDRTMLPFVLPSLAECADLDAVMAANPLPSDAAARERIASLRHRIDEVATLQAGGELQAGLVLAQSVVDEARGADFAPVLAEALTSLGALQVMGGSAREAQTTLEASIAQAAVAKDDVTAAKAWTWLVYALVQQHRVEEGRAIELAAAAAVDRAGDDEVRGWLLNNLGALYGEQDFQKARGFLQEALDVKTRTLGPEHVDVGISWANLGNALVEHEDHVDARAAFEHALTVFERTVGTAHPLYNYALGGLCRVEEAEGRYVEAVELCARVLEHFEVSPSSNVVMGSSRFVMARALREAGRPQDAEDQARQALELVRNENPGLAAEIETWLVAPSGSLGGSY